MPLTVISIYMLCNVLYIINKPLLSYDFGKIGLKKIVFEKSLVAEQKHL